MKMSFSFISDGNIDLVMIQIKNMLIKIKTKQKIDLDVIKGDNNKKLASMYRKEKYEDISKNLVSFNKAIKNELKQLKTSAKEVFKII